MLKVATALPNEPYREYKDVERVYSGSTEIDKILDKNGNVLFAVNKEVEGTPALTYKGKEETNLKNYRIYGNTETKTRSYSGSAPLSFPIEDGAVSNYRVYGQTSRNLFEYDSEEVYSNSTLGNLNHWDYADFSTGTVLRIPCTSNTTYTLSIADDIEHSVFRISTTYLDITPPHEVQSGQTGGVQCSNLINDGTLRTATFTTSGTAKYILFQTNTNIFQNAIETLMLNVGSTGLPYEPYGESVGDKTANILPLSRTPITETHGDFLCEYDGLGTITLTTDKDNATTDGEFVIPLIQDFTIPVSIGQGGTGCLQINNDCYGSSLGNISFVYNSTAIDALSLNELNRIHSSYSVLGNKIVNQIAIYIVRSISYRKITIRPAFVENVTERAPFEPYGFKIPITNNSENVNIYLDEPLRKVGDEAEYVDYAEQKRYNADGTNEDVTLPALPAQSSSNSLSVGTTVQPSSVAVDVAEVVSCGDKVTDSQSVNYGKYKIPVTLTAGSAETTDIYLDTPLRKVGDEAEYIDYGKQKQHRVRKNLLKNTMARQIINGVTFTANEDGSITCNGTAGASAPSVLNITFTLPIELYEVSGCPDSGGNSTYRVDIRNNDSSVCNYNGNSVIDNGTGCLFDGGNNKNYCIRIAPGYTCDNLTFYPMIRRADITDDTYEPYIEDTELDVTLPALPTLSGTNTLTVGTEVQPSNVYLKGRIKEMSI